MRPSELKPRIGLFGRRNRGKSSLANALAGQQVSIVSAQPGTTTDPVRKTMELAGVGPVILVDTAGLDDSGRVGEQRVQRSLAELEQCDLALLLLSENQFGDIEKKLIDICVEERIPYLLLYSLSDLQAPEEFFLSRVERETGSEVFVLDSRNAENLEQLRGRIADTLPPSSYRQQSLLGDVVAAGDSVVLVTPIDTSAPEGRLILPQVQVLRDLLDNHAFVSVCRETELRLTLENLRQPPRLVITDSQVFPQVAAVVPDEVWLTSFSVLLARAKGPFAVYLAGARSIERLRDGDRVLILESCTHTVTCEDIGRVKIPSLLERHTGRRLYCDVAAGMSPIPNRITDYALVIQCGGCVATPRQLHARLSPALRAGVPITNYGLALAYLSGILERSVRCFGL